jgi:CBS domain-containing protein
MKVQYFMIPKDQVATVHPEDTILSAAKIITERQVGSVVVVNNNGLPLGIITKTDIVTSVVQSKSSSSHVIDIMSDDLLFVEETAERDHVADVMAKNKKHHVLVKNTKGEFVGLTTTLDVVHEAALDAKAFPYNRSAFRK